MVIDGEAVITGSVRRAVAFRNRLGEWWRREDSNLRHGAYETPALPPELRRRNPKNYELAGRDSITRPPDMPEIMPIRRSDAARLSASLTMS